MLPVLSGSKEKMKHLRSLHWPLTCVFKSSQRRFKRKSHHPYRAVTCKIRDLNVGVDSSLAQMDQRDGATTAKQWRNEDSLIWVLTESFSLISAIIWRKHHLWWPDSFFFLTGQPQDSMLPVWYLRDNTDGNPFLKPGQLPWIEHTPGSSTGPLKPLLIKMCWSNEPCPSYREPCGLDQINGHLR